MATGFEGMPELDAEARSIERKRRMAEMLMQQGQQPLQTNQMAGGYVVPVSPFAGVANLLNVYRGKRDMQRADESQKGLTDRYKQGVAEAIANYQKTREGTPGATWTGMDGEAQQATPATPGDPRRAVMEAITSQFPQVQRFGSLMAQQDQADETRRETIAARKAQAEQAAQDRLLQIQLQAEQGRITRQEADARAAELRRELQASQFAQQRSMAQLAAGLRQPPQQQVIQGENGPMILGPGGVARPVTDAQGNPLKGKGTEKALPTSAAQKLMENNANLRKAQQALLLIEGKGMDADPNATGLKGFLPDAILQRTDPKGVTTRAAINDLGSMVIHDRSGAAVTAAEYPRLRPFIPLSTDDPETAKKKLKRFVSEYQNIVGEATDFYKESGYKVPGLREATPNAPAADEPPPGAVRPKRG